MLLYGNVIPFHKTYYQRKSIKMLTTIIALFISLGVITSAGDYTNLSEQERQEIIENQEIIIEDITWF